MGHVYEALGQDEADLRGGRGCEERWECWDRRRLLREVGCQILDYLFVLFAVSI